MAAPVLTESLCPTPWLANKMHEPRGDLWLCQGSGTLEDHPVVPVGSRFGINLQKQNGHNGHLQHRLGRSVHWQASVQHLVRAEALLEHQLSGYGGGAPGPQGFSAKHERPSSPGLIGQHDGGCLH